MKILYVASEAAPFAVSGGLSDVMGALPKTVKRLLGKDNEIGVILPLYASVSEEYRKKMKKISEFHFYHSWRNAYCSVYLLRKNGVSYYFVDNEYYFKRNSLYGISTTANALRIFLTLSSSLFFAPTAYPMFCTQTIGRARLLLSTQSKNMPRLLHFAV